MSIFDDNYEETLTPEWMEKAAAEEAWRKIDWNQIRYCGADSTLPDPIEHNLGPGIVFNLLDKDGFELYILVEVQGKMVWHRIVEHSEFENSSYYNDSI